MVGGIKTCGEEKPQNTALTLVDSVSERIASACDELEKLQVELEEIRICAEDIKKFVV